MRPDAIPPMYEGDGMPPVIRQWYDNSASHEKLHVATMGREIGIFSGW